MRFLRVQTDRISVTHPPSLQTMPKMGFSSREPSRALQVPTPPNLMVLNSIISLIHISEALGHPKMRFWRSRPTEFLFSHRPAKRC